MKPPTVFKKIQTHYAARERMRREVVAKSNEAIGHSKRAIFALHREDHAGATQRLADARALFVACEKLMKVTPDLRHEGAFRAALEEYAEALLFIQYLESGVLGVIEERAMEPGIYLAGLADTTGEIVRHTVRQVTLGKTDRVIHARDTVDLVMEFMLGLDATGYLRTKFDQAKGNLKRLEEILYDLSIRQSLDVSSR